MEENKSEIQIFNSPKFGEIRTALSNGNEPVFCASDVCKTLGYTNPRKAIVDHVEEGDVTKRYTPTKSGYQLMTYVNESGLYTLIFGSKLNSAKQFKRWVTSEVLPAIRKTGGYIAAKEDDTPEMIMARAILVANDTIERQKKKIAEQAERIEADAPYVDYANSIMKMDGDLDMYSVARVLADNYVKDEHGKPIGRNGLFKALRRNMILMSDRRPYQRWVDKAYFGCYIHKIDTCWGEKVTYVPTLTPKGLKWLLEQITDGKIKGLYMTKD
ncbi:MAG: phage antirepressor KilAC domain-containing protein [Muribaculaceae bacterium]|nr:phage antirepressor KilAC domain-containing protein [Muribaculaceae bacterium]